MMNTYLFIPDSIAIYNEEEDELFETNSNHPQLTQLVQHEFDHFLFKTRTKLLALRINEWFAHILGKEHPYFDSISTISQKITGNFKITHKDSNYYYLEHIASKRSFAVLSTTLEVNTIYLKPNDVVFISLIRWKNNWLFSGVLINHENKQAIIEKELNSNSSYSEFVFLDIEQFPDKINETLTLMNQAFWGLTLGAPMIFITYNEVQDFINLFFERHRQLVLKNKLIKINSTNNDSPNVDDFEGESDDIIAVSFNPKTGLEFGKNINQAFTIPRNKYYRNNISETEYDTKLILCTNQFSCEFCNYLIETCKYSNPFFKTDFGKTFLVDTDFLYRFYKNINYVSLPTLTLLK